MTDATLPPLWNPDTDDTLVCVGVRRETHDVLTFILAADPPRRFDFRPGQFMTYALEIGGETVNRCYTISSAPTRPDRISLTVKAVPGGPVSHWLHAHLKPGARLSALGPMGDFHWTPTEGGKQLFLSAGSGITPLLSMTRAAVDLAADADIAFVHSARSPADLICRDELAVMARHAPRLKVTHVCETDAPGEVWGGYRGRLDLARLELIAPDFREREVRFCGPSPYMAGQRCKALESRVHHQPPHSRHSGRPFRPGVGQGGRDASALVLHQGHVRYLQVPPGLRHRGDDAGRGHPSAGDRPGPDPDLLLQAHQ